MRVLSSLKVIRLHCLECSNKSYKKVKDCQSEECLFYSFRFGTNPKRKGIGGGIDNFKRSIAHSSGHKNSKKGIVEADAKELLTVL